MVKETVESMLDYFVNEKLTQIILSNPVDREKLLKVKIRPIVLRHVLKYQAEEFTKTQAFHRNMDEQMLKEYIKVHLQKNFKQAEVLSVLGNATVLVGKRGSVTVKTRRSFQEKNTDKIRVLGKFPPDSALEWSHNRKKRYILEEGIKVPFLIDLGVMTNEGRIAQAHYHKFRQINRFLELVEDILPSLDKTKESVIIDFGCGKSYLTFAMYYYLHELKGYPVRMIGLDLKKDVISRCEHLAKTYGYDKLTFLHGDIASFTGENQVDMVVTLHACDTATDFALAKAVKWGAKVILSVPCCQHELNGQIHNPLLEPVLQYGLIKERMAALYTDAIRAQLLEAQGYRTQILEFIDMEHTSKNILIRSVWDGKKKNNQQEMAALMDFLQVKPSLNDLFQ